MKIIKAGKIPSNERHFTCGYCKCEFIADPYDVHYNQKEGDFVVCPTCHRYINWVYGINKES